MSRVKQPYICLLLLIALLMQSVAVSADSNSYIGIALSFSQSDDAHHKEHHDDLKKDAHEANNTNNELVAPSLGINVSFQDDNTGEKHSHAECHHCGHCTSPHVIYPITASLVVLNNLCENNFPIENFALASVIENTYRPPII